VPDKGDLAALARRVREEIGLPVAITTWRPDGRDQPLRPLIDDLLHAGDARRGA
jgi:hypothetical protein